MNRRKWHYRWFCTVCTYHELGSHYFEHLDCCPSCKFTIQRDNTLPIEGSPFERRMMRWVPMADHWYEFWKWGDGFWESERQYISRVL